MHGSSCQGSIGVTNLPTRHVRDITRDRFARLPRGDAANGRVTVKTIGLRPFRCPKYEVDGAEGSRREDLHYDRSGPWCAAARRAAASAKKAESFSMPMNRRPSVRAATPVDPEPIVKSSTISPSLV